MGKRHHYVPRFYLRAFQSQPKRIHVLNLERNLVIRDASLRDQCYVHNLYGGDGSVEAALAKLETAASPVLTRIRETETVPDPGSSDRAILQDFLAVQLARTVGTLVHTQRAMAALRDAVFEGHSTPDTELTDEEAMRLRMSAIPETSAALTDLAMILLLAPHGRSFVTSDNPAFCYNQYREGVIHRGVQGLHLVGLQLFLPVAKSCLLMAYDTAVYKVGSRRQRPQIMVTEDDVTVLNGIQLVSAHDNVYFGDDSALGGLRAQLSRSKIIRRASKPRVVTAVNESDPTDELIHQFTPMPQLSLSLSCIRIRREARRNRQRQTADRVRPLHQRPIPPGGGQTKYVERRAPRPSRDSQRDG